MKKFIATLALVCVVAAGAFGQTNGMLNINEYSKLFTSGRGGIDSKYLDEATDEDYDRFVALGGDVRSLDTHLEIALLSTCAGVANVRPAEANRMLGNAKQADQKLGAAVFQEIQVLRFLGDTAAVNRHEAVLQFITDRKNVTRAEIETYYRNNIRGLVSQVVDAEFGKTGEGGIVPARIYADWEKQGIVKVNGKAVNGIELIKQVLGDFFLSPTETNYIRVRGIIARIGAGNLGSAFNSTFSTAWADTLISLSPELESRIRNGWGGIEGIYAAAEQPNDPVFEIFEIPYSVKGR